MKHLLSVEISVLLIRGLSLHRIIPTAAQAANKSNFKKLKNMNQMNTKITISKAIYSALFSAAMLIATSSAFAQVKIGTNPTVIEAASNLEVEASIADRQFKVNKTSGQVTIKDGTEGVDYVLTSDANGNARWQSLSASKVPTVVFIGGTNAPIVLSSSTAGAIPSRVPLNPVAAYAANWNAASRAFVVPVAGYYRAEFISQFSTTTTNPSGAFVSMALLGKIGASASEGFVVNSAGARTLVETAYYNAGDLIYSFIWSSSTGNAYVYISNMNITYIP